MRPAGHKDRLIDLKMFFHRTSCLMISPAVLVAVVERRLFILFSRKAYIFISVNCNTEFWSLSSD